MTNHRDLPEDLRPEPARRAPDALQQRVFDAIDAEPIRRRRVGRVLAPIAAGSVLIAGVFGAVQLSDSSQGEPANTPSSAAPTGPPTTSTSPTSSSAPPSPSAPPSSAPANPGSTRLDVRPMTDKEVTRDLAACLKDKVRVDKKTGTDTQSGDWRVRYAMIKQGDAPASERSMIILSDNIGVMTCLDGTYGSWALDPGGLDKKPAGKAQGIELPVLYPASQLTCEGNNGPATGDSVSNEVGYRVSKLVATVRSRMVSGDGVPGPWRISIPNRGIAVTTVVARDEASWPTGLEMETQLLDSAGNVLPLEWYDDGDSEQYRTQGTTATESVTSCEESRDREDQMNNRGKKDKGNETPR